MELTFCGSNERRKLFDCAQCPEHRKKVRRCREDRMDFTEADNQPGQGIIWPLYVEKGGALWTFCPGKATWDEQAKGMFRLLLLSAETGTMLIEGGLLDQPSWWIDLLAWFVPRWETIKFTTKCEMVLGGSKAPTGGKPSGAQQR